MARSSSTLPPAGVPASATVDSPADRQSAEALISPWAAEWFIQRSPGETIALLLRDLAKERGTREAIDLAQIIISVRPQMKGVVGVIVRQLEARERIRKSQMQATAG